MKHNNIFDLKRLLKLINQKFLLNSNGISITLIASAATLFILFFIMAASSQNNPYTSQGNLFFTIFIIGGYLVTSRAFGNLGTFPTTYQYLVLPVSNLERLVTGWLFSSVFYSIAGIAGFIILSSLANLIGSWIWDYNFEFFCLCQLDVFRVLGIYMVTQTIFLLGAAAFKSHAFLKTILAIFVVSVAQWIIVMIFGFSIIAEFNFHAGFQGHNFATPALENFFSTTFPVINKILFWYIMPVFFVVVSYFKLKEREV